MTWFLIHLLLWLVCGVSLFCKDGGKGLCGKEKGVSGGNCSYKNIGRMTNITEVLVQIKSNKREGKKHLAQG